MDIPLPRRALCVSGVVLGVAACAPRLQITYGPPEPVPLVQPSTDRRRWYVPMEGPAGPALWFVDTGYARTTCDDDLVVDLGLEPRGRVRIRGVLGKVRAQKASLPPLQVGGHAVEGLVCHVRDLGTTSSLGDPPEVPIAGVLGMDVWSRFRLVLDPAEGVLRVDDPARAEPLAGEGLARLRKASGHDRVRVALSHGGRTRWPVVDTGAATTSIAGERLGLTVEAERTVTVRGTGEGGAARRTVAYYAPARLQLGPVPVRPTALVRRPRRGWFGPVGLLGLDVLGALRQSYDFEARRLLLEPVRVRVRGLPTWQAWVEGPTPGGALRFLTRAPGAGARSSADRPPETSTPRAPRR